MSDNIESIFQNRKHPVHGIKLIDGQPTVMFDTVCTKDRKTWLANDEVHSILKEVWIEADSWLMGRYVIMPDHIHYFAWYTASEIEYENWVRYWKSQFTKRYQRSQCRWQRDDWDHRVRSFASYERRWQYVRYNPVRQQLVEKPDEWQYQGEIHSVKWQ